MKKALSLLLCLLLLVGTVVPCDMTLKVNADEVVEDDGVFVDKTAKYDEDNDRYIITLEAYATGEKVISSVNMDVPTDIVLVIDQSGSMSENISGIGYNACVGDAAKNETLYSYRHNGGRNNLWYKVDETYYSVSVTFVDESVYSERSDSESNSKNYRNRNNLYAYVNGEYKKVSVSRELSGKGYVYTYTLSDGTRIAQSTGRDSVPTFTSIEGGCLYSLETQRTYTYSYTDAAGTARTIGTSVGRSTEYSDVTLYKRSQGESQRRLDALVTAAKSFVDKVNLNAKGVDGIYGTSDDVNHRIAVVGFASDSYNNTELLTGVDITKTTKPEDNVNDYYYPHEYAYNGVQYGSITSEHYKKALQSMDTEAGYENVSSAIAALTAHGATRTDHGIDMANSIFANNEIPTGETRQRVMVVFTDGIPTTGSAYDSGVASNAINNAGLAKSTEGGYGATVYTIGIFDGADATRSGSTDEGSSNSEKGNYVCQQISSNDGVPRSPSYYLSAGDSTSLNNIFRQIADQITENNSSTTLNEKAVIRDIIAPQFELIGDESDITLEAYACTGKVNGSYTWEKNDEAMTANVTLTDGDKIDVTGFDFKENYVGEIKQNDVISGYRGNKLVIQFAVKAKDTFLGGNDVYTNTSAAIYENSTSETPVKIFPRPQVNVSIKDISFTLSDKNVYLYDVPNADELYSDLTVKCGNVDITDPSALADWQKEYVNISDITIGGISEGFDGTADGTYSASATVSPKTVTPSQNEGPTAITKTKSDTGSVKVFKPEVTFKDSTVYYGGDEPDYAGCLSGTAWKHGETLSTSVTMLGDEPILGMSYTPESGNVDGGKIVVKNDFNVDTAVSIGKTDITDMTTFVHTKCNADELLPTGKKFIVHVLTGSLTVSKIGGAANESYVFDVYRDGNKYTEVTVWGNDSVTVYELPLGTYSIEEKTDWSWRYSAEYTDDVELTEADPDGSIVCTNTKKTDKWLNGFSEIVKNAYTGAIAY